MKKSHILFILLAASLPIYTHGQNSIGLNLTNPLKVNRISGKINFDGIPDEIVWQNTEALPFGMLKQTSEIMRGRLNSGFHFPA